MAAKILRAWLDGEPDDIVVATTTTAAPAAAAAEEAIGRAAADAAEEVIFSPMADQAVAVGIVVGLFTLAFLAWKASSIVGSVYDFVKYCVWFTMRMFIAAILFVLVITIVAPENVLKEGREFGVALVRAMVQSDYGEWAHRITSHGRKIYSTYKIHVHGE